MRRGMRLELSEVSRDFELQALELEVKYLLEGRCEFSDIIQLFDCMVPYQGFAIEKRQADNRQGNQIIISRKGWRA